MLKKLKSLLCSGRTMHHASSRSQTFNIIWIASKKSDYTKCRTLLLNPQCSALIEFKIRYFVFWGKSYSPFSSLFPTNAALQTYCYSIAIFLVFSLFHQFKNLQLGYASSTKSNRSFNQTAFLLPSPKNNATFCQRLPRGRTNTTLFK